MLPLVERELAYAGRTIHTYRSRIYLAGVAFAVMLLAWIANARFDLGFLEQRPEFIGSYFVYLTMAFQYIVVVFVAPSLAVSVILRETEERALPLLLLACRHPKDILVAKFVSVVIHATTLIVCLVPLQAIAALLGGIEVAGLVLQGLSMAYLSAVISAVGLCFSVLCRTSTAAIALVQFVLVVWFVGTSFVDAVIDVVGLPFRTNLFTSVISMAFHPSESIAGLPAIGIAAIIGSLAFGVAVRNLPRAILLNPVDSAPTAQSQWARANPHRGTYSLVFAGGAGLGMNDYSDPIRVMAFIGLCGLAQFPVLGWLLVLLFYLRTTARGLAQFRAGGALDELLVSPQTDRELVALLFKAGLAGAAFYVVPILLGITGAPFHVFRPVSVVHVTSSSLNFVLVIGFAAAQLAACAAIACFVVTVFRPRYTPERLAVLLYLVFVLVPFLVPYLCLAMYAVWKASGDVEAIAQFMFGPFVVIWGSIVSAAAAVFFYRHAVKRIRVKLESGRANTGKTFSWPCGGGSHAAI